jgi:hypothetical protein
MITLKNLNLKSQKHILLHVQKFYVLEKMRFEAFCLNHRVTSTNLNYSFFFLFRILWEGDQVIQSSVKFNKIIWVMLTSASGALVKDTKEAIFILKTSLFYLFKH